ncbi:hypothetical protein B0T20DRAFT_223889 [Sordaria brevicollis]|uniref:Secreted protein n=1 Tax=Sordaria brevicollis TaxID=83679 RepID=A0AAE0UBF7_SORBR|nr:hypothetical protein B0T20DRAFT_223889 [Sordaria brevicollis]
MSSLPSSTKNKLKPLPFFILHVSWCLTLRQLVNASSWAMGKKNKDFALRVIVFTCQVCKSKTDITRPWAHGQMLDACPRLARLYVEAVHGGTALQHLCSSTPSG